MEARSDLTIAVSFGVSNLSKIPNASNYEKVILCADNDDLDSPTQKAVEKAAKNLSEQNITVFIAEPHKPDDKTKWDFNDALVHQGLEQVRNDLEKAKPFSSREDSLLIQFVDLELAQ